VLLETPVSTGKTGYPTRPGEYVITQKYPEWKSTLYKVPMPNFMRLSCGQTGLHGGVVPGVPASHGCIRLPKEMAELLYQLVQPGDRVSVFE
jgi:lipoprotein-anchoring transpeptidase ErfK/SrfK